jgi:hypothetical protein
VVNGENLMFIPVDTLKHMFPIYKNTMAAYAGEANQSGYHTVGVSIDPWQLREELGHGKPAFILFFK